MGFFTSTLILLFKHHPDSMTNIMTMTSNVLREEISLCPCLV